jgi:two-component system sensor histidine kinase KdpD
MMVLLTAMVSPFKSILGLVNIAMIYLLPVLFCASKWGTGSALAAAAAGVITFDLFFVPPTLRFTVADIRYLISFAIFILVGLITGTLSTKLRKQVIHSQQREAVVSALYALSRDIAAVPDLDTVLESVVRKVADTVDGETVLLLPETGGKLEVKGRSKRGAEDFPDEREGAIAGWVFEQGQKAGRGTETFAHAAGLYLPLRTEQGVQGVLSVRLDSPESHFQPEQLRLLEAFAGLAALAVNRIILAEKATEAQTFAESERLRTALFNSLSHDLRTPLASIMGAVTSLLEGEDIYSPAARRDLLQTIQQGAARMQRFVTNLLDMARLESGMLKLKKEWCDIQDIIGVAVSRSGEPLRSRPLKINIQHEMPLVQVDFVLIEQVLINLLDNALKYSRSKSEISVSVRQLAKQVEIAVTDRGPQLPDEDLGKIFDKFYRLKSPLQVSGTGLGLAICRGIVEAHGGKIWAENNSGGGVTIIFVLPLSDEFPGQMTVIKEGDI